MEVVQSGFDTDLNFNYDGTFNIDANSGAPTFLGTILSQTSYPPYLGFWDSFSNNSMEFLYFYDGSYGTSSSGITLTLTTSTEPGVVSALSAPPRTMDVLLTATISNENPLLVAIHKVMDPLESVDMNVVNPTWGFTWELVYPGAPTYNESIPPGLLSLPVASWGDGSLGTEWHGIGTPGIWFSGWFIAPQAFTNTYGMSGFPWIWGIKSQARGIVGGYQFQWGYLRTDGKLVLAGTISGGTAAASDVIDIPLPPNVPLPDPDDLSADLYIGVITCIAGTMTLA